MKNAFSSTAAQRTAIQEAARWFARLQAPGANDATQAAWTEWLARHPDNHHAWSKVRAVQQQFSTVPAPIAMPTLQNVDRGRRRLFGWALLAGASAPFGAWLLKDSNRAHWTADFHTSVGEVAPLPLPDRTVAILDTHSAADVEFTPDERRVVLRAGRLYAKTHPDEASHARPFVVQTAHGRIEALGTEFMVRVTSTHSKVWVNQRAVRITPAHAPHAPIVIEADHRAIISDDGLDSGPVAQLDAHGHVNFAPWRNGSLVATNLPLARFVNKFQAYQRGYLFVDDQLADLKISGVFPLFKPELALSALENSYPVQVRRLTRYLTWIEPRA